MFKSARIKLTIWYVLSIMIVTISFSSFVFVGVNNATQRALEGQRKRIEVQYNDESFMRRPPRDMRSFNAETLMEIRNRTLMHLLIINGAVFVIFGSLSYFFAGITLKPIEEMVDKQKRFISDAAHEIKTPLTVMKTSLEVALRDKNLDIEKAKATIKSTIEEVDNLNKLSNSLLNKSKYQNNNGVKSEIIEIDKLLESIINELSILANSKKIVINADIKPAKVLGDSTELRELFANLIENAIKYNKHEGTIDVTNSNDGNTTKIVIKDSGQGIEASELEHIFDPFYRVDESRKDSENNGYGLGLTIAKEIVEKYNGTITVESKIDVGSTFTVILPSVNSQHS